MSDLKDMLLPALRQYRHNNSDEFVAGYDKDDTVEIVSNLLRRIEKLSDALISFKTQYSLSPWIQKQVDDALE